MDAQFRTQVAFHLTARRPDESPAPSDWLGVRPALLAAYRDLAALRYDFPLVLIKGRSDCVRSLSSVIDTVLQKIAPRGVEGERVRRQVLRLEQEIRRLAADGRTGSLSALWRSAAEHLRLKTAGASTDSLNRARDALDVDGEVVDCDADMPSRLVTHAWRCVQEDKLRHVNHEVDRLSLKLADILKADFARSEAGRSAASLQATVGPVFAETFDFEAMSRILAAASGPGSLSANRRRRIEWALSVLGSQRFLKPAATGNGATENVALDEFIFDGCSVALRTFRRRLPEMVDFIKAVAIAELEVEGRYMEQEHDRLFADFDQSSIGPKDLARFPDYLICIRPPHAAGDETAGIVDVLSSGIPAKVLVQTDDLLGALAIGDSAFVHGGARLGPMAIGLNDIYVLQTASSNLYAMRDQILNGLAYRGATLVSVFSGAGEETTDLPPYLNAAAATQSRAFPTFSYDPSAGADLAQRFSLTANPQPEADWTSADFTYEDEAHQRVTETVAFTYVDFLACDHRYERHFAPVPKAKWTAGMSPVADWMAADMTGLPDKVPYIATVNGEDVLQRAIADEVVIAAARRCRDLWHRLQELGGLRGSYAERLRPTELQPAGEQSLGEAAGKPETGAVSAASAPPPVPAAAATNGAPAAAAAQPAAPETDPDLPYIETPRCTSCNECTQINSRMFAYDENKQARIADPDAGTYRQLVEAAESCQVSIIHPGKPRNPNEPGLDELLQRAEAFK
jgi:hypothetical protein